MERLHDLYLDKTLGDKNAALVALRGAIEADPTKLRLYEKSAQLHFLLGKDALASNFNAAQSEFQNSIAAQQKCVELTPQDQPKRRNLWQRHIDIAEAATGSGAPESRPRIDFAQAQYRRASELLQHEITLSPREDISVHGLVPVDRLAVFVGLGFQGSRRCMGGLSERDRSSAEGH